MVAVVPDRPPYLSLSNTAHTLVSAASISIVFVHMLPVGTASSNVDAGNGRASSGILEHRQTASLPRLRPPVDTRVDSVGGPQHRHSHYHDIHSQVSSRVRTCSLCKPVTVLLPITLPVVQSTRCKSPPTVPMRPGRQLRARAPPRQQYSLRTVFIRNTNLVQGSR